MPIFGLLILGFLGMTAAYTSYDKKTSDEKPPAETRTPDPFSLRRAPGDGEMDPTTGNRRAAARSRDGQTAPGLGSASVTLPPGDKPSGAPSGNPENAAYLASVKFDGTGSYEELTRRLASDDGGNLPAIGGGAEIGGKKNGSGGLPASTKSAGTGNRTAGVQGNADAKNTASGKGRTSGMTRDDGSLPSGKQTASLRPRSAGTSAKGSCPEGMADIEGRYCIDKWEATVVDRATGKPASPFYTPSPSKRWPGAVWQYEYWSARPSLADYPMPELPDFERSPAFSPMAVSRPGVFPQGFMNKPTAELACRNAGKRLCAREEWHQACSGPDGPRAQEGSFPVTFPYGKSYEKGKCNFGTAHPLMLLKRSNNELSDPRLMLAESGGRRVLARTGEFEQCTNGYGVYDMVGNQDEIVDDAPGGNMVFVGSFYSRAVSGTPRGCGSAITSHAESYNDYSIGFRCCSDVSR